ncbi:MAG: hypothetical protein Q9195_001595 [Heterodermia aff. obscurata]
MLDLSQHQLNTLATTERVGSCFSLAGIAFIFATFLLSPYFKKSINRQIFYASIGNLGVNLAALISEDGPAHGQESALCQLQGFLVQMFLGVDCFWSLCMAVNVYLIFFHKYTIEQLRAMDWKYLIGCYGASFIPAFVYIFVETKARGRVYGPATIWCWVTAEWDPLRIALLYGIVWIAIVLAFTIYCMAGKVIWQKRKELQGFLNPLNENPFKPTVTTEIHVTSRPRAQRGLSDISKPSINFDRNGDADQEDDGFHPYSVNVEAGAVGDHRRPSMPDLMRIRTLTRTAAVNDMNAEAWLYARTSFLFFLALLITWVCDFCRGTNTSLGLTNYFKVPSSVNRVYGIAHPTKTNFALNYASSLVFPLQGFWNVLVYIITSQTACKCLWARMRGRPPPSPERDTMSSAEGKKDVKLDRIARRESQRLDSDDTSITSLGRR